MRFQDLDVGTEFFDPVSGDYWVKLNATQAQQLEGDAEDLGVDSFDPEEEVERAHAAVDRRPDPHPRMGNRRILRWYR